MILFSNERVEKFTAVDDDAEQKVVLFSRRPERDGELEGSRDKHSVSSSLQISVTL